MRRVWDKPFVRDLSPRGEISGPRIMVAWAIASLASRVARVGGCTGSSPVLPLLREFSGPLAVR